MKKFLLSAVMLALVSAGFANNPPVVNEKVLESFKKTFNPQQEVTWYENESNFEARFTNEGIKTIVWYNKKGEMLQTHRYYDASKLPPIMLEKLNNDFPKFRPKVVTEVTNRGSMFYNISLESEKTWIKIHADVTGEYEISERFRKG